MPYAYFVRVEDTLPGEEFHVLLHRLRVKLGDDVVARQMIPVPLCAEDIRKRFKDIDFDFVVANPHLIRDGASVAFQNVREQGRVAFSIGLKKFDATVNRLREFAFERNLDVVWKPVMPGDQYRSEERRLRTNDLV